MANYIVGVLLPPLPHLNLEGCLWFNSGGRQEKKEQEMVIHRSRRSLDRMCKDMICDSANLKQHFPKFILTASRCLKTIYRQTRHSFIGTRIWISACGCSTAEEFRVSFLSVSLSVLKNLILLKKVSFTKTESRGHKYDICLLSKYHILKSRIQKWKKVSKYFEFMSTNLFIYQYPTTHYTLLIQEQNVLLILFRKSVC